MTLDQIWIYPVKSLPGIRVQNCYAGERGMEGDRRYMLCDRNGKFISLRQHKNLYEFHVELSGAGYKISHSSQQDTLQLPSQPDVQGSMIDVRIWEDTVTCMEPFPKASNWFSRVLSVDCKLVYMQESAERLISEEWRNGNDRVSFADGYAYLVTGEGSLKDITSKAGIENDPRRFRPNLVIGGTRPYEEYLWRSFSIGKVKFTGLKPCERCVVTTIDPETMETGKEPLQALAREKTEGRTAFGMHASIFRGGIISTGDVVSVTESKESPYQRV